MPRKLLFVVNPNAGKGAIHEKALSCIDLFVPALRSLSIQRSKRGTQRGLYRSVQQSLKESSALEATEHSMRWFPDS